VSSKPSESEHEYMLPDSAGGQINETARNLSERKTKWRKYFYNQTNSQKINVLEEYLLKNVVFFFLVGSFVIATQQAQRDLQAIIRELRFITSKLKKKDDENDLIAEWKFAAMVVDRICLFIFTMFTIIATLAVLFSAPHIIVQ
jgi:hypothetical protein